jgi:hypothetical protein
MCAGHDDANIKAMDTEQQAVFLFVDEDPSAVAIYPDLDWARGSLESLDVASFRNQAFLATGQVVELADSGDCSQLSLSPIGSS